MFYATKCAMKPRFIKHLGTTTSVFQILDKNTGLRVRYCKRNWKHSLLNCCIVLSPILSLTSLMISICCLMPDTFYHESKHAFAATVHDWHLTWNTVIRFFSTLPSVSMKIEREHMLISPYCLISIFKCDLDSNISFFSFRWLQRSYIENIIE